MSSKLTQAIYEIEGMSSNKVRDYLNKICQLKDTRYLEVGLWKGSTFISACYGNELTAWGIENFSEFAGPRQEFTNNFNKYLGSQPNVHFIEADYFSLNLLDAGITGVNVFFYDGAHTENEQYKALDHAYESLADKFIYIVDDWNHQPARDGTMRIIEDLKLKVVFKKEYPANFNGDKENYWNGLGVFYLKKSFNNVTEEI